MSEVDLHKATELGTLADKINAEHRACQVAVKASLEHAMAAGDLLLEARAECPYGTWQDWIAHNFEGSLRTAQIYMYLARRRVEIGEAKAQSSALSTISEALYKLALRRVELLPVKPQPQQAEEHHPAEQPTPPLSLEDSQPSEDRQQEQERALRHVRDVAQAQAKRGDPNPPPDMEVEVPAKVWEREYAKVVKSRTDEAGQVMTELLMYLAQATVPEKEGFRPEEAGAALLEIKPQDRALTILRDSVAWLQRVLEEAEREQARMQDAE